MNDEKKHPNCFHCIYFRITYEPAHPYACRLLEFKSKVIPRLEVFRASGIPCQGFTAKKDRRPA